LRAAALEAGVFCLTAAILAWQSIQHLHAYVDVTRSVVTAQGEFGNLLAPLDPLQMFGIWLSGDYRLPPTSMLDDTYVLIGVALLGALFGLLWLVRRRALAVGLYVAVSLLAWWYVTDRGSPWADGKALTIVSPAVVLVALLGGRSLVESGRRIEGAGVVALVGLGVLASNALAYHDVALAPHGRLEELASVGERLKGTGPTLYPEFEEFGKHFLRDDQPEGPSEVWHARPVAGSASQAGGPRFGVSTELDQLALPYIEQFRSIVLRRGFAGSRPPANFRAIWHGRWYEIWQRTPRPRVLDHVVLGVPRAPAAVPKCRELRALGRRASEHGGKLALSPLETPPLMAPGKSRHSPSWVVDGSDALTLVPVGPGEVHGRLTVPRAGRYDAWLEGSFERGITVLVDGRPVGKVSNALNARGDAEPVATLTLSAGTHAITLLRGGGNLAPGNGIDPRVGPLALMRAGESRPVVTVAPRDAARWCGRSLDWMEIVA
jgi:hypothetical protein